MYNAVDFFTRHFCSRCGAVVPFDAKFTKSIQNFEFDFLQIEPDDAVFTGGALNSRKPSRPSSGLEQCVMASPRCFIFIDALLLFGTGGV
jgi:hypothetical protein